MNKPASHVSFELSNKLCFRQRALTKGLRWAHYQNEQDRLFYINDQQHTLSMYIEGGFQTHRTDIQSVYGAPGRFCLIPKGSESRWQLGEPQQFMHLYFDDNHLKQLALRVFDLDPRLIQLPELTFSEHPALEALVRHTMSSINWDSSDSQLMMEQVTDTILVTLLQNTSITKQLRLVKGGLAPRVTQLICDFIQANYQRQIYLHELAELAQLSEYHFCRMFKQSMAQTPQQYLTEVRVERVKHLLGASQQGLAEIALACGFSNQSHMGRYFKQLVGISPSGYRRQIFPSIIRSNCS